MQRVLHSCQFAISLKRSFACVSNWRWAAHTHITISFLRTSTTLLLYASDTVVAVVISINKDHFCNLFYFNRSHLLSCRSKIHAETLFCVSRFSLSSNFSVCSTSMVCFVYQPLPLSYSSDMTSA